MNLDLEKYGEGSNFYNYLKKDERLKKNIITKKEENLLTSTYFFLKFCLFLLSFVSLIKIGYVTQLRHSRLQEIKNSYMFEKDKFIKLTNRFDDLLSDQGEQRFMKDQDQMISRDVMRVIWR